MDPPLLSCAPRPDTRSKSLHESTVAAILQQVGEGLNYLHQNGLIGHDQFSSSNLFVDRYNPPANPPIGSPLPENKRAAGSCSALFRLR
jgi:serine/threonine protein kinase